MLDFSPAGLKLESSVVQSRSGHVQCQPLPIPWRELRWGEKGRKGSSGNRSPPLPREALLGWEAIAGGALSPKGVSAAAKIPGTEAEFTPSASRLSLLAKGRLCAKRASGHSLDQLGGSLERRPGSLEAGQATGSMTGSEAASSALQKVHALLLWRNRGCGQPSPSPHLLLQITPRRSRPQGLWCPPHPQNARDPKTYFTFW